MAEIDRSRLYRARRGQLLAGVAGLLLLVVMFLPWFGPSEQAEQAYREARGIAEQFGGPAVRTPDLSDNAWEAFGFLEIVFLASALAGIGLAVVGLSRPDPDRSRQAAPVAAVLGTLSTLLVLYHLIDPVDGASRDYGLFLALLAAAGIAVGARFADVSRGRRPRAAARPARRTRSRSSSG